MEDDIDIEEHNVMDNPRIKTIFPNIRSIKIEVDDYDGEENIIFEEEGNCIPHHKSVSHQLDDDDYFETFQSKIILGTKPSTSNTPEPVFQNKIILGSKACSMESSEDSDLEDDPKLNSCSVVLSDWGSMLANNPCFCQPCQILFPTVNALDFHKMSTHSFLVAVRNNKAVKSTSKGSLSSRIKVEPSDDRKDLICNHCNEIFPNEIALIKHTYELLPGKFECDECEITFDSEAAYKSHLVIHSHSELYIVCPICTCHFRLASKLQSHMWNYHEMRELGAMKRITTNFECHICGNKLKDAKSYNMHITNYHPHLYEKRSVEIDSNCKFRCAQCNLTFSSDYALRIHLVAKHSNEPNATIDENKRIPVPTKKMQVTNFKSPKHIPKLVLFKCNKCQIHFVSCTVAAEHSESCIMKKGEWKCQKCRRMFMKSDHLYHTLQHRMTDKFRIYETSSNILSRLLCVCKKCMLCFDERSLLSYHADGCSSDSSSIQCNDCCKRIGVKAFATHRKVHAEGIKLSDFLIVNYVPIDQSDLKELPDLTSEDTSYKNMYLYCPTCKCFMRRNRICDKHSVGKCNFDTQRNICKVCGLRFTFKAFKTHKMHHKNNPNLKLSDLKFVNIQTKKKINPPFPDFNKCKRCHVHFCSAVALNNHVCNSEEPQICVYCGDKFSDLAFNLHVPFHEYTGIPKTVINEKIPELIKKYESLKTVWNILFLCQTCDIVMDSYDKVIEHCQDHFSNMESYNVNIKHCRKCNLNFVDDCFGKHEELHLSGEIQKDSFKILIYKYDALLSDDWLDIFISLTKEQVDLILSKSKYKYTRRARMRIIINGPVELTLYQCGVCELIIPSNKVAEHSEVQDKCIENPKKFPCEFCGLLFLSKNHKEVHEKLHVPCVRGEMSYRIIQFVADKHLYSNDLEPKGGPEELKFIRCQHCGKLINKAKYKKHMYHHGYYTKRGQTVLTMQKLKKSDKKIANIVHKYYVCQNCNLCVTKPRMQSHKCSAIKRKVKCPKCSLWFRHTSYESHERYHDKYPFNKNNMNIIYFEDGKIVKERRIKLKDNKLVLYECAKCRVCLIKKDNMKKHACRSDLLRATCEYCHLKFHCSFIRAHKYLHESNTLSNVKFYVYKFEDGHVNQGSSKVINAASKITEVPAEAKNDMSIVEKEAQKRYNKRPASCLSNYSEDIKKKPKLSLKKKVLQASRNINFELSIRDYRRHIAVRYYKCSICNLLFVTCSALMAHEDTCNNDSKSEKCEHCGLVFHDSMIHIHKSFQKCEEKKLSELGVVTVQSKGKNHHMKCNWIYLCRQCNIYNVSFVGIMKHISAGHKYGVKIDECDICNIRLSCISYGFHRRLHHGRVEIPFSDLNVATVECAIFDKTVQREHLEKNQPKIKGTDGNDSLSPVSEGSSNIDSDTSSSEDDKSEKVTIKRKPKETISKNILQVSRDKRKQNNIGIFNCDVCNINFVNRKSLQAHKSYGSHAEEQYKCTICSLMFSSVTLKRHMVLHHRDVQNNSRRTDGQTQQSSFKTDTNHIKDGNSGVVQATSSTNGPDNKSALYENSNKLFKCSSCDIYFLTAGACYDHASLHTSLDPTEYIACKMCDLQFLCENLGQHMKCHRDKTFCMDDLIVTEYQLVHGKVKMDTYLAVDRLKSKLVSTTTHSDIEDEKAEADSNCVDSTTENIESHEMLDDVESSQGESCDNAIHDNPETNDTSIPNYKACSET